MKFINFIKSNFNQYFSSKTQTQNEDLKNLTTNEIIAKNSSLLKKITDQRPIFS